MSSIPDTPASPQSPAIASVPEGELPVIGSEAFSSDLTTTEEVTADFPSSSSKPVLVDYDTEPPSILHILIPLALLGILAMAGVTYFYYIALPTLRPLKA